MRLHCIFTSALVPACVLFLSACATQGDSGGTGGSGTGGGTSSGSGGDGDGSGGNGSGAGGNSSGGNGSGGSAMGGNGSGGNGSGGNGSGGNVATGGSGGKGTGGAAGMGSGGTGAAGKGSGGSGSGGTGGAAGAGTGSGGSGGGSSGPVYNPNFVEFSGSDCPAATPKDVSISGQLPNLFTNIDGTTMSKRSDWRCRRAEMKAIVEKYIFGAKPAAPMMVTGSVSSTQIKVHVDNGGGKVIDFTVPIRLPSGAKMPAPIIIGLTGSSLPTSITDPEGVATGTYDIQGMMSESSRTGLYTTIYGTSTGVSSQIGWAWGFSRIIDVLISEKAAGRNDIIDPTAVGVTGCSRDGKGAFTVGAFDERIALGIPQESGTAGVSAMRIVNTQPKGPNGNPAQSLSNAVSTEVGWFGSTFESTYITK
ncbi:MAG TPA: hypothetical protein VI456_08155, partial [Polyangia bacterium]